MISESMKAMRQTQAQQPAARSRVEPSRKLFDTNKNAALRWNRGPTVLGVSHREQK